MLHALFDQVSEATISASRLRGRKILTMTPSDQMSTGKLQGRPRRTSGARYKSGIVQSLLVRFASRICPKSESTGMPEISSIAARDL